MVLEKIVWVFLFFGPSTELEQVPEAGGSLLLEIALPLRHI